MVLFEELRNNIHSTERKFCYGAPYIDRFCDIVPAGTRGVSSNVRMKHCLEHLKKPSTPKPVHKIESWRNPDVEQRRVFHAIVDDPQLKKANEMCHGIQSKDRTKVKDVIRPKEPSAMEALSTNTKEQIYESSKRKPLGTGPEPDLPEHVDRYKTTFGLPNKPDGGAGPLINPPKERAEILREEAADRIHYLISHKHLIEGEQGHRRYVGFDPDKMYGMDTHCDPRGIHVRRALNWVSNDAIKKHTPVMSRRQFDFKERYDHKLGKPRDPIADTMSVSIDHTFGLPSVSGDLTVGQILHGRIPRQIIGLPFDNAHSQHVKGMEKDCVVLTEQIELLMPIVHHALREARFWRGTEITAALCHLAKGEKYISMVDARELFHHFEVPLDEELTELVFDVCAVGASEDMISKIREHRAKSRQSNAVIDKTLTDPDFIEWAVDWRMLAAFCDWKRQTDNVEGEKLKKCGCALQNSQKSERVEVADAVRRRIQRAIDANILTHATTSLQYRGDGDGLVQTDCWLRLGKPSVDRNKLVPKTRGVQNKQDYGDEANLHSVIHPSIYTEYGVTHRSLLTLRNKDEIKRIMDGSGLTKMFNQNIQFDDVWAKAAILDKSLLKELAPIDDERVSLHSFKEALFKMRTNEIRSTVDQEFSKLCC